MTDENRVSVVEQAFAENTLRLANLEKRFDKFIETDREWSNHINDCLSMANRRLNESNITVNFLTAVCVGTMRKAGLSPVEALEVFETAHEVVARDAGVEFEMSRPASEVVDDLLKKMAGG